MLLRGGLCAYAHSVGLRPRTNGIASACTANSHTQKDLDKSQGLFVVGGGGFEPPKSETSDLQSDAFGHSAIRPY